MTERALYLLANCTATCVRNGFIYNGLPTVGRYYFSFGHHLDSNKPEDLSPVPKFILRNSLLVCWLFSFVKPLHLGNIHTRSSSCVDVLRVLS
jgi:hypothetical protein